MIIILIIPLLSFITALVLLTAALIGRGEKIAFPLAITATLASLGFSIYFSFHQQHVELLWFEPVLISFQIDGLSSAMQITSCLLALSTITMANHTLGKENSARSFGFIFLFLAAALTASMSSSLLVLLISWELMAISIWQLTVFLWKKNQVTAYGAKTFLMLRLGDLGLYAAAAAAFAASGSFEIETVALDSGPWLHFIAAGLVLSAMVKSAQLPFSVWLGTALKTKPHINGTLMGTLLAVSGGYLLVRSYAILGALSWTLPFISWAGAITALLMAGVALVQSDIRQVLAASSASQKGFIFMAIGLGALPTAVGFIIAHAAYKGLLFLGASKFQSFPDESSPEGLNHLLSHESKRMKTAFVPILFTIALLALSGIPPLSGWIVKDKALSAAFVKSPGLFIVGTIAGFMTSLYAGRLFWIIFQNQKKPAWPNKSDFRKPVFWAMVVLTLFMLSTTVLIFPGIASWWATVIIGSSGSGPIIWIAVFTGILAFLGLGIVRSWQSKKTLEPFTVPYFPQAMVRNLRRWLGLFELLDHFKAVIFGLCRRLAYFDTYVLDKFTNNLATLTLSIAKWTANEVENSIDITVASLSGMVSKSGKWAKIPQTGLLHNYYAQAVMVIGIFIFFILWLT